MYIQIKDGEPLGFPVTDENLRLLIPANVSLPLFPLTPDVLPFGFAVYEFAQIPVFPITDFKVVEEGTPGWTRDDIRGEYVTQVWDVRDMTDEEKEKTVKKEWENVRILRDHLLFQSDWTQFANAPISDEKKEDWAVYRQSLRDITTQPDPFALDWPTPPA